MAADIQQRLNDLVNYSSQLIFVGGDTLSSQTKALETFLFQQNENTEIAYVVSEPDIELAEYRKQLCQQLLGPAIHLYHRPLNECLSSLNQFEGPVMIAITRAEFLPKQLLQELWELVLQSRFGGNKQHLNVILFAEKKWAKEAKSWLPDNSSGAPLLLSTQQASLYQAAQASPSAFKIDDTKVSVSSPRAQPEQQIEQRPLFSMGAFWAATLLLFIGVFAGVTLWQKGDRLSALFTPIDKTVPDNPKIENIAFNSTAKIEPTAQLGLKRQAAEAAKIKDENSRVLDWQQRHTTSEQNEIENSETIAEVVVVPAEDTTTASPVNEVQTIQEPVVESTSPAEFTTSYQSDKFAVQLAGFKSLEAVQRFRNENDVLEITESYHTQRYGGDWYVVIQNQLYNSTSEAKQGIADLPEFNGKNSAFVKSTNAINQELNLTRE